MPTKGHRSFRLTPRPDPVPPELERDRLPPESRDEAYRRFAARRREVDRAGARLLAGLLGTVVAFASAAWARWHGVAMASCCAFVILVNLSIWQSEVSCPNCTQSTRSPAGPYCPACGDRSLGRRARWSLPECGACGVVARERRRRYLSRFCSHCGVLLDERGF